MGRDESAAAQDRRDPVARALLTDEGQTELRAKRRAVDARLAEDQAAAYTLREATQTHITVRRFPSIVAISFEIAPLVRLGVLTDAEGRSLVDLRYFVGLSRV